MPVVHSIALSSRNEVCGIVCRYEEDVLINNHTSVWGSWWQEGVWGYACCHQTLKNSYCTGKAGEKAAAEVSAQMVANLQAKAAQQEAVAAAEAEKRAASTLSNAHFEKGDTWGTEVAGDVELDEEKIKAALRKLEKEGSSKVSTLRDGSCCANAGAARWWWGWWGAAACSISHLAGAGRRPMHVTEVSGNAPFWQV
jgi:hypothetical protein